MATGVFMRREFKYRIDRQTLEELMERIGGRLEPDGFHAGGRSVTISNIYYDTPHGDLIRMSIDKPAYKEKLRLRAYGRGLSREDIVFVEIKKKVEGVVGKRRLSLPLGDAMGYLSGDIRPAFLGREAQIDREVGVLLSRYPVQPAVFIAYDRVAWYDREDSGLRITFDSGIRTRRERLSLLEGDDGAPLLPEGEILMEVKAEGGMPFWLARTFSQMEIHRTSFSKYGTEFTQKIAQERGATRHCFPPSFQLIPSQEPRHYPLQTSLPQSAQRSS